MTKINVRVQPRAANRKITGLPDGSFKVYVNSPAAEGRANKEMIELLAKKFDVAKSSVRIVSGHNSRNKILEILQGEAL